MDGWIWPDHDYAWLAFFVLDGLGAAAAVATGRAFARSWSPQWQIAPAMIVLAAGVQWLHFALFQEDLLSLHYYLVALVILLAAAFRALLPTLFEKTLFARSFNCLALSLAAGAFIGE